MFCFILFHHFRSRAVACLLLALRRVLFLLLTMGDFMNTMAKFSMDNVLMRLDEDSNDIYRTAGNFRGV